MRALLICGKESDEPSPIQLEHERPAEPLGLLLGAGPRMRTLRSSVSGALPGAGLKRNLSVAV